MMSKSLRTLLFIIVLISITVSVATIAGASGSYDVTSEGSVDVPDRTLSFGDQEFDIESVGYVMPGDPINAEASAPDGQDYVLYLYDNQATRVDFSRMTGDGSSSFSTNGLEPGTYNLVIRADKEFKTMHPAVISGYDAEVEVAGELVPGEPFTLNIELTERAEGPSPDAVTVLRRNETGAVENVTATEVEGSSTYEAELTAPADEEEVQLLTTVFGEESISYTSEREMLEFTQTTLTESEFNITADTEASLTSVTENDTADIVATVENTGDFTGERTVELRRNDTVVDTQTVSLNGHETTRVNLAYDTAGAAPGEQSLTVGTADSTDTISITVTADQESDGSNNSTGTGGSNTGSDGSDSTDSSNDSDTGSQSAANSSDNGTDTGTTDTDTTNGTADAEPNESDSDSDADTDGDVTNNTSGNSDSGSANNSDDDVITPNDVSADESPLSGFPHFILALLVIAMFVRLRE